MQVLGGRAKFLLGAMEDLERSVSTEHPEILVGRILPFVLRRIAF